MIFLTGFISGTIFMLLFISVVLFFLEKLIVKDMINIKRYKKRISRLVEESLEEEELEKEKMIAGTTGD